MSKDKTVAEHIHGETRNNIIINLILNGIIAYATLRGLEQVTTWGEDGYGKDLFITGFILSTILGGIFIGLFRRRRKRGEVVTQGNEGSALAWLLPYNPWLAAPWIGVLGALLAAPALLGVLALLGIDALSPLAYAIIKGTWAGILAGIVVPVAIRQGLRAEPA